MKLFKIITTTIIALCATSAWADLRKSETSKEVCSPVVHLKIPEGWPSAYLMMSGYGTEFPKADVEGWSTIDLSSIKNNDAYFYINAVAKNDCNDNMCLTVNGVYTKPQMPRTEGFTCAMFAKNKNWHDGGDVWIQEHPDPNKAGEIYISFTKPDVKDFFIFLPNNSIWKSATPMIYEVGADGKTKDIEMYFDSDNCGWYYRRYIDEEIPKDVLVHRDDDENREEAIGLNGSWEEGVSATPIPLKDFMIAYSSLDDFSNVLYFVADEEEAAKLPSINEGWYISRPPAEGKCGYDLAAMIYDTDASLHGAFTCSHYESACSSNPAICNNNACFYSSAPYNVVPNDQEVVPCIGVTKNMVENTLYIDPTTKKKSMVLTTKGKKCFGSKAEEAFKAMFNYTPGVNEQYCFNMPFTQAKDGKFEFDSDTYWSPGATVKGGFYPAEEPPEAVFMVSDRLPAAENKRLAEGPIFFCPDYNNAKTTSPEGLRTIHPTEGVPMSDLICNGGGWEGGIDCEGLFATGSEFYNGSSLTSVGSQISKNLGVTWEGDGWGWNCELMGPIGWPYYKDGTEDQIGILVSASNVQDVAGRPASGARARWTSGDADSDYGKVLTKKGRNQHFCMESHATFRYKKNLKFSFRGDDDIWIFINNKLAVDIGGTHLPAPGFVDVDKFLATDNPIVGYSYPIDIYFCDRRTTMSNIHIKTNMFIEQKTGIDPLANQDKADYFTNGNNHYLICFTESGDGSCAAALNTTADSTCGSNIKQEVTYELTTDKTGADPEKVVVSTQAFKDQPKQFKGGIDVSKKGEPVINRDILKDYFAKGGTFYLLIHVGNQTRAIEIKISGSIGVADRDAVFVDDLGNRIPGFGYKGQAVASTPAKNGSFDINQMVPLYIAAISDPCAGETDCHDSLEIASARGSTYSLAASNKKAQFFELKNGVLVPIDISQSRKVGDSGVDTVYVTVPFDEMGTAVETVNVNVTGNTRVASINFFVPTLKFVKDSVSIKQVSTDPDSYVRMKGHSYEFYVAAFNPDGTVCTDCNFPLISDAALSSPGLEIMSESNIVNGRATIRIRSSKVYLRNADASGTATFAILGSSTKLMSATYTNMQFQEPPVSTPQFADIFDVHGEKSTKDLNIPKPYFNKNKKYLDGIGDSLVVYYHRTFNIDSLPDKIVVFWSDDKKDSVLFTHEEIVAGASCGSKYKWEGKALSEKECLNRISLGGKNLSKTVKTSGTGLIKSWATYCPKYGSDETCSTKPATTIYECIIYDRIAPIIVSAEAATESANGSTQLKLTFSEKVQKTTQGALEGDNVFSYYLNSGKNPEYIDFIPLTAGVTLPEKMAETHTLLFSKSSTYPQVGDYIHFRSLEGVGFVEDQSDYKFADSLRKAWNPKDSTYNWNTAPGYDATKRLPSPWVLIEKMTSSSSTSGKSSSSSKKTASSSSSVKDSGDSDEIPDFYVRMTGAFEFEIVIDDSFTSLAKRYAVMDMNGQVISVGEINEKSARVKVPTTGAYVVKVNLSYKRINVK